ncbi:MAG: hypothetical protein M3Q49_03630 [Actinomycetota bacterium]|nr:hypothetical protein [Actinomycetota bacterium]
MQEKIKQRIASITSEVDELHPLLRELFRKHPKIPHFEYTHGPEEMGADFVLTHPHELLGSIEYIGIIAKRGKIHQNFDDVERQIRECTQVPREIENGKKRVVCSQVWVVTTGNITGGAKKKIHANHPGTNVQFVDGNQLASLVAEHVPSYHAAVDLPVSSYLSDIKARSEELDRSHDIVQGEGEPIYIEQDVLHVEVDPYRAGKRKKVSKPKRVDFGRELSTNKVLLVEAGMGGGKSKMLRKLTQHHADVSTFAETKVLPVHATFKELVNDHGGDLHELLAKKVPREAREAAGRDTEYLFLVDGVDEKDMTPEDLSEALEGIVSLVEEHGRYRLVLASRYIGNPDVDRRLSHRLTRYEIAPLSTGKIVRFLNAICRRFNLQTRIIEDLQRSTLFGSLPQHPMAAVLLGHLLAENQQELPSTMTDLYQKYMEFALGRWDARKGLQSDQEFVTLENVLMDLAGYMLENELEVISSREVEDRFRAYLDERNLKVEVEPLVERAIKRADVLARSNDGHAVWFRHRSFAEFLYAQWLRRHGKLEPSVRAFELYWANTYFFGLGLQKDAPELLESLIAMPPETEGHRWMKVTQLASFLMAAYHTPKRVIEEGVHRAALEAAELFRDAAEGRVPTPFSKLSRMHLLYFIQLLMRDNYGYEFLAGALEEAAGRLLEGEEEAQVRAYAIFLVSVAYIDAGRGDSFDWLLEEFKGYLPLDLRLAVWHEGEELEVRNKAIKKLRRNIEANLGDSRGFREKVKELHERPITSTKRQDEGDRRARELPAGAH